MVGRVREVAGDLGRAGGRGEAAVAAVVAVAARVEAVGGAEGGEAGDAGREDGAAAGFFGEDDFVEEADCWVCGGVAFAFVNEFVEGWRKGGGGG